MSSRPAILLVILIISIIALCLAGVFAAMTGPINLNLNLSDHNDTNVNLTENLTPTKSNDYKDTSSYKSNVQTYSDSGATPSSSSQSQVHTTEDSSSSQSQESSPSQPSELTPSTSLDQSQNSHQTVG